MKEIESLPALHTANELRDFSKLLKLDKKSSKASNSALADPSTPTDAVQNEASQIMPEATRTD
jgi:hypothetical protein